MQGVFRLSGQHAVAVRLLNASVIVPYNNYIPPGTNFGDNFLAEAYLGVTHKQKWWLWKCHTTVDIFTWTNASLGIVSIKLRLHSLRLSRKQSA